MTPWPETPSLFITGALGQVGGELLAHLSKERKSFGEIVAADLRLPATAIEGVRYIALDVRDPSLVEQLPGIDCVVHLAAVVNPRGMPRELARSIDVDGTENVLRACVAAGVRQLIATSSGAAYGYHPDNAAWLDETDPIRGNEDFPYAHHKRLVEELLARYRREHPELRQLVLRPGTILGATTHNQITNLFEKRFVLGIAGSDAPFVFIWDQDAAACMVKGAREGSAGVYNLAGDGAVSMREIAAVLGKPYLPIPAPLLRGALAALRGLGLTEYGPEQVNFLRYRPVLSNRRLKEEFGYTPRMSSREVFEYWVRHSGASS